MNSPWIAPAHGMVKVNCHGVVLDVPAANGNTSGLGVILRRFNGKLISCAVGSMPRLSPLGNQLWAIFSGMRRAFLGDSRRVIIETDNIEAFGAIKFPNANASTEISSIVQQILVLKNNQTWNCYVRFVYASRNKVATYLALLGAELFTRVFLFSEPLGRAAELMDLDLGLGPHDPDFLEMEMAEVEMEQLEVLMANEVDGPLVAGRAATFLAAARFQLAPPVQANQEQGFQDVAYEDDLDMDEGAVVMQA